MTARSHVRPRPATTPLIVQRQGAGGRTVTSQRGSRLVHQPYGHPIGSLNKFMCNVRIVHGMSRIYWYAKLHRRPLFQNIQRGIGWTDPISTSLNGDTRDGSGEFPVDQVSIVATSLVVRRIEASQQRLNRKSRSGGGSIWKGPWVSNCHIELLLGTNSLSQSRLNFCFLLWKIRWHPSHSYSTGRLIVPYPLGRMNQYW